jgi:hypothetical protein
MLKYLSEVASLQGFESSAIQGLTFDCRFDLLEMPHMSNRRKKSL